MHLRSRAKYSLLISIHQLQAALLDIHEIFFEIPVHERMALIAHSRQLMEEKRLRDSVRAYKKVLNVKFNLIGLAQGHKTLTSLLLILVSLLFYIFLVEKWVCNGNRACLSFMAPVPVFNLRYLNNSQKLQPQLQLLCSIVYVCYTIFRFLKLFIYW